MMPPTFVLTQGNITQKIHETFATFVDTRTGNNKKYSITDAPRVMCGGCNWLLFASLVFLETPVDAAPENEGAGYGTSFDFTKLDTDGKEMESTTIDHVCVKDNVTGLIWEVKTDDGGLRDEDWTYTWYDSNSPDDNTGTSNGGYCADNGRCDTEKFVQDVNATGLCGNSDWRLPNLHELASIVDYSVSGPSINEYLVDYTSFDPAIDAVSFPATPIDGYLTWTNTTDVADPNQAWGVDFNNGESNPAIKSERHNVRLVRDGVAPNASGHIERNLVVKSLPASAVGTWVNTQSGGYPFTVGSNGVISGLNVDMWNSWSSKSVGFGNIQIRSDNSFYSNQQFQDSYGYYSATVSGNFNGYLSTTIHWVLSYTICASTGCTSLSGSGNAVAVKDSFGACSSTTSLSVPSTASRTLGTNCRSTAGRYYNNFTFAATAGRQYTVTLNSTAFDAYLYLRNSSGTMLAYDDDGNGGQNSKIVYTAITSGTLTFNATTYGIGATGAYTVAISGGGPAAPSSLSATAISSSQIKLSWRDNSVNETGFKIERKTGSSGTWSQIATVGANVVSYLNTGLLPSTLYYYRARAYNTINSGYSNETSQITKPGACAGTNYVGTLGTYGHTYLPPNDYYSSVSGIHKGILTGPVNSNFGLDLHYATPGVQYRVVASGQSSTSIENVSYSGNAGYYFWGVHADVGGGSYSLCITHP